MNHNWRDLTPQERRNKFVENFSSLSYPAGKGHPAVKLARDLIKNSNKSSEDRLDVIIEGFPIIEMAYKYNVKIKYLFICPEDIYSNEILAMLPRLLKSAHTALDVSPKVFDLITQKGNSNGLLAIGEVKKNKVSALGNKDLVVVLDGLETPGNIGSIIRSADAVDAKAVIVTNKQAHLYHPLMIRSSRGACFKIPIIEDGNEIVKSYLEKNDYQIVLADPHADSPFFCHTYEGPTALVMGSERFGISKSWYDSDYIGVSIPMFGDCDSLNVSIATTVLLYEIRLKKNRMI